MERTDTIRLHATPHHSVEVRKAGFPLDHPYLEHCWTPLLGPTAVVLLRRIPQLWRDQGLTAELTAGELAASIGLGRSTGRQGPLGRTFERLVRFRFVKGSGPGEFDVFTEIPPVRDRQLERLPAWNRQRHDDLLDVHLDHLAASHRRPPSPADVSARLDAMTAVHAASRPVPTLHR